MASSLRDLELLMDYNTKLVSSAASPVAAAHISSSLPIASTETEAQGLEEQALALQNHRQHAVSFHHRPSLLASLSLAFGPVLSFNPCLSKSRVLAANSIASSGAKLLSQKKCISPTPVMPAISAATTYLDMEGAGSSSVSVGSKKKFFSAFPDYLHLPDRNNSYGNPNGGGAMRKASIVWFRSDLRCHDNEALATASKESVSLLPVYVFDPREFGKSSSGFDKTGPYRARFLLQCVSDLREKIKELGSDLVVRIGKPEEVLLSLAKAIGADALYAHLDVSYEGLQSEKKVRAALQEEGVETKYMWGNTLFHVDDLPFKVENLPDTYSAFHEKVSKISVRETIETPKQLKGFPIRGSIKPGDMPTLEELGVKSLSSPRKGTSIATPLIGGEKEALKRLERLVADYAGLSSNKANTKASLHGSNFSSKISPWLSLGCLSPRHALEGFRSQGNSSASMETNTTRKGPSWLVYELLWRDFFRFVTKKQAVARLGAEATKEIHVAAAGCA
ncbi:hypothetical protein GOP47_0006984 [Adiantum capillus-veneris]|uniref:Photolyase/cryptochrome alpha/beta domain-containing protein n=1 Tax=Adiantum capillus-veneris TaxID=13818 RepID=A0A9D4UZU5_ADICA|nr:hypothetical protein GOP47_0006984 [Adiantum capillus-veneris]